MQKTKDAVSLRTPTITRQAVKHLQGDSAQLRCLNDDSFNEEEFVADALAAGFSMGCCYFYFTKLQLLYLAGDYPGALAMAHKAEEPVLRLKERYRTEQMYREAKQELGLNKYEGRGYRGFTHHVTVVLCCYAFLVAHREGAFPPEPPASSADRHAGRFNPHQLVQTPERPQRHVPHSIATMRRLLGRAARRWLRSPPGGPAPRASPPNPALSGPVLDPAPSGRCSLGP